MTYLRGPILLPPQFPIDSQDPVLIIINLKIFLWFFYVVVIVVVVVVVVVVVITLFLVL